MKIHHSYRTSLRSSLLLLLLLATVQYVFWPAPGMPAAKIFQSYQPLHALLELFSIVTSMLIFVLVWGLDEGRRPANLTLLACTFLGVGALDSLHVLSYPGMPDFATPSGTEKAINFWLGARAMSAFALLAFLLVSAEPLHNRATRWLFLAATLLLVALAGWMGLLHPDWAPHTFSAEAGLTLFKVRSEYALVALYLLAAIGFLRQMREPPQACDVVSMFTAACMMALSEVFFTLYSSPSDVFNFLGHVYKFIAYVFLYRTAFNGGIKMPYQRLQQSREALAKSNQLLHNIIETIPLRVFWKDRESRYAGCNTTFARDVGEDHPRNVIGKLDSQLKRKDWAELRHNEDSSIMALNAPQLAHDEMLATPDKGEVWLRTSKLPIRDANDEVIGVLGIYDDITERKKVEQFHQLTAAVYETSTEGIMVTDSHNLIVAVNPGFTTITGFAAEEVLGKRPAMLESGLHDKAFYAEMTQTLRVTGGWHGEMWYRHKSGEVKAIFLSLNCILDPTGGTERYVAMFSDITQRKKSEELIWRQANYDLLTGLPNRSMFYDRLEQDIKKSLRGNVPMALMLLDLDLFKEVNDTLGHDIGDLLLKDAAQRLSSCVRETDTVARLGGDEFGIVLGELDDPDSVQRVAENILSAIAEPFHLGGETVYISASVGITLHPDDATSIDELLKNADQAMYAAKHRGRNRYSYYTKAMQDAAQARMRLANDLRRSLDDNQFKVYYQPIVDLTSGEIHKAEALLRWQHPTRGMILPAEFIPIAEHTGMIIEIGDWVFHQATHQAARWRSMFDKDFQISVNKSPVQFRHEGNSPWIANLLESGGSGASIVVEITEGLLMDASASVSSRLLAFRDAGIHVSLDDFGTGYSSLAYLKKFDIDYLKIDQSFVHNMGADGHDRALCEAIIVMAHKLDIKVIAEGVETLTQRDLLAEMKCDYAQGYFYCRPVPPEEFESRLKQLAHAA